MKIKKLFHSEKIEQEMDDTFFMKELFVHYYTDFIHYITVLSIKKEGSIISQSVATTDWNNELINTF